MNAGPMPELAAAYAAAGALVLPLHTPTVDGCSCRKRGCEHPGKHPRTMRGKDDATADLDTVSRWWSMWPDANIGIRPHPGHVVLDIDPRNGGDIQLEAMQRRYGPLPATRTAVTGSGGLHIWLEFHGDVRGQLAAGIDIKSHGGYVVAPPSRHAVGGEYRWTNAGPIVPAPAYLRPLLARPVVTVPEGRPGAVTPAVVAGLVRVVAEAVPGERHRKFYWACCRAAERGMDMEPLIAAAVRIGYAEREARRVAATAYNAPRVGVS